MLFLLPVDIVGSPFRQHTSHLRTAEGILSLRDALRNERLL